MLIFHDYLHEGLKYACFELSAIFLTFFFTVMADFDWMLVLSLVLILIGCLLACAIDVLGLFSLNR
jgi:cell division protein FtsX